MAAEIDTVGSELVTGWGIETTPGTAVAATNYVMDDPKQQKFTFDPDRKPSKYTTGTPFVDRVAVDKKGKGTGSLSFPVGPTMHQDLLAQCGLTSAGLAAPASMTFTLGYGAVTSYQYAGCRVSKIKLDIKAGNDMTATVDFDFTRRLLAQSPLAVPAFVAEDPYVLSDMGLTDTIGETGIVDRVGEFEITIDLKNAMFYGAGQPLPTRIGNATRCAEGSFSKLFTELSEVNAFIAPGGTMRPMVFRMAKGAHSLTITVQNAKYNGLTIDTPMEEFTTTPIKWIMLSPNGADSVRWVTT